MNVTLPDGTTVQGIPDGTTKAQLAEKLKANGMNVPNEWLAPAAQPKKPDPSASERFKSMIPTDLESGMQKDPGLRAFVQGAVPEAGGPGAALKAAGRVLPKAITEPVKAGADWLDRLLGGGLRPSAEKKAADVIRKTASDLPTAERDIKAAANAQPLVKGGRQTTAAQTTDEGMLGLEKTVRNFPGASERAGREIAAPSNVARSNVVGALAGDAEKLEALKGARQANANKLYRSADTAQVNVDKSFKDLMERDSMKKAVAQARVLAKEAGDPLKPGDLMKSSVAPKPGQGSKLVDQFGKPIGEAPSKNLQVSGKGLHYIKMALDQQLERTPTNSITNTQRRLISNTRDAFMKWTEDRIPAYKTAREQFLKDSRPINRMELMQKIQAKATSNATDAAGNKIITRNGYQNAIKQYRKDLERTLTPVQLKHVDRIAKDLDLAEKVNSPQIRPAGSETIRHANAQETPATILGKLTGGTGAAAAATSLVSKFPGFRWLSNVPPERVREILIDAMLDPKAAEQLLAKTTPQNMARLSDTLQGIANELGVTSGAQAGRAVTGALNPTSDPSSQ